MSSPSTNEIATYSSIDKTDANGDATATFNAPSNWGVSELFFLEGSHPDGNGLGRIRVTAVINGVGITVADWYQLTRATRRFNMTGGGVLFKSGDTVTIELDAGAAALGLNSFVIWRRRR